MLPKLQACSVLILYHGFCTSITTQEGKNHQALEWVSKEKTKFPCVLYIMMMMIFKKHLLDTYCKARIELCLSDFEVLKHSILRPRVESCSYHLLVLWPWSSYVIFLGLSFPTWRMGLINISSIELLCWLNAICNLWVVFSRVLDTLCAVDLCWQFIIVVFFFLLW